MNTKTVKIGKNNQEVSTLGLGCMRIASMETKDIHNLLKTSLDLGITFIDHANIYGKFKSEERFAEAVKDDPSMIEKMFIQTKCGIRPGVCFDFSKDHILKSVEESLTRLNVESIDSLLLHRPDALVEPEEVAEAFYQLKKSGKVKIFGVCNSNPYQIELLNKYCNDEIVINQLQLSITESGMIDAGLNVNMQNSVGINRDGSVLDYCRLNNIRIQAWSPFQYGQFEGVFIENEKFPELNKKLDELAEKYNVTNSAIAIAWILRHPANIQPIVGTTNQKRLQQINEALNVMLTREEWYELYLANGKKLP